MKLRVRGICSITNFDVHPYKTDDKFKCVQNDYQLIFNNNTKVRELEENGASIPYKSFDFYDHGDLKRIKNLNVYLIDVIEIIQNREYITLKDLVNRLGQKNLQTKFSITDGSSNVNVTFWDAMTKLFYQQLTLQPVHEHVIIIITSCKIGIGMVFFSFKKYVNQHVQFQFRDVLTLKTYATDQVDISNVGATTFYLNYQHHSVTEIRKR
ncbi:hypothetical protein POM88_023097 [Heracleum sosnowskyi]|uniref:Uncharacterized protein n=1 Tax=Heracleum sosnowskyi TaxID=360622 RepID=A0AAD8IJ62_9APIA|nr:hypothetical protein POM88_023097 [Heracleum sosnowskyi]